MTTCVSRRKYIIYKVQDTFITTMLTHLYVGAGIQNTFMTALFP